MSSTWVELGDAPPIEHLAVQAWQRLDANHGVPASLAVLKTRRAWSQATIYRLHGIGNDRFSVIAKRGEQADLLVEQTVYEQILPQLPVEAPRYFGTVDDDEKGYSWLFLESIDGERYSESSPTHSWLASHWFGRAHAAASALGIPALLPHRGPDRYLNELKGSRRRISDHMGHPGLDGNGVEVLAAILGHCDALESRWDEIDDFCARMPRSLVHGDFFPKNARVRLTDAGPSFFLFDWGAAAWSNPAVDIAGLDLNAYHSCVSSTWPELDRATLERLERIGTIFRSLALIEGTSVGLEHEWIEKTISDLDLYKRWLARARMGARLI